MKQYSLIVIGTGSAMNYIELIIENNPGIKIAVIDKDEPGGICLTRGCTPSKLLIYPADLVRTIGTAENFSIGAEIKKIDFPKIMERMRAIISKDIERIKKGLSSTPNIDYYQGTAEFTAPYTLKVGSETITSKMIFLCTGSKTSIPPIKDLKDAGYLTSDTLLELTELPKSLVIIGGGYIAAEYSHFFSAMGSIVTVIGRNPQLLPDEEPEISALAKKEFKRHMDILTGHEVIKVEKASATTKKITAKNTKSGKETTITAEEILVATGRSSNSDILHPERSDIKTDKDGWILVDEYLETSQPDIWAFGDADGKHLFKHKANYESQVVYHNVFVKKNMKADYHAVPHAIFSHPEIASVGMKEKEAIEKYGEDNILIGFRRYEDTTKGDAMKAKDCFAKIIVENNTLKILGAHIIGPDASVLIHEIINLMYTSDNSAYPILYGMHIHPSLSEVVSKAFESLVPPAHYHHILGHLNLEPESD